MSESPLRKNFDSTLALVRDLRKAVRDEPVIENAKGGLQTNPAYVLLSQQEIHLRGMAQQLGPLNVEKELLQEFDESMELVDLMMPKVQNAPVVEGERHLRVRNPYGVILAYAQTHLRGCNALLQKAKTPMHKGDTTYEELFKEPDAPGATLAATLNGR